MSTSKLKRVFVRNEPVDILPEYYTTATLENIETLMKNHRHNLRWLASQNRKRKQRK